VNFSRGTSRPSPGKTHSQKLTQGRKGRIHKFEKGKKSRKATVLHGKNGRNRKDQNEMKNRKALDGRRDNPPKARKTKAPKCRYLSRGLA